MLNKRVVEKLKERVSDFTVACSFENVEDGVQWAFVGVYGPNIDLERWLMWEDLVGIIIWWELPSCIGGNFNVSRYPSERSSTFHITPTMRKFFDFIS